MSTNIPADLKYTEDHEWVKEEGEVITIGITDFAQSQLGDIVFVELPDIGQTFNKGDSFGVVESIKSVSDLYLPVDGEVIEKNEALEAEPELINTDAYDAWMIKIRSNSPDQLASLLDASMYEDIAKA